VITGMDRLTAAINGEESDRIPVFCNLIDQGAKELNLPLKEYFSKGEYIAEAQLKMREKYGYDNVWCLFYVGKEAEMLGCKKIIYAQDGPPNVEDFVIKTYADVENLTVPHDLENDPRFTEQLNCLKILKQEVGGNYPICAYITSTMSLPILLMGMEKWFELLFMGPVEIRQLLLDKCFDFFVKEIKAYRNAGANILVYSNPFGSTDTVPMKYFMETSLPLIQREIKAVGPGGMVYYCGMSRFNKVLSTLMDTTDFSTFYLSPLDDIAQAKQIIAGRGLTCGVINDIQLIEWSRDQIRHEVKQIIDTGMPGGKFLFGTGVMPYNISEKNIQTLLDAAYEYGSFI